MAGAIPHSNETPSRRATRLALGVAIGFLMKDDIVAASTLVDRLWQMILAGVYVIFAFSILEWVRSCKTVREPAIQTGVNTPKLKEDGSHD